MNINYTNIYICFGSKEKIVTFETSNKTDIQMKLFKIILKLAIILLVLWYGEDLNQHLK